MKKNNIPALRFPQFNEPWTVKKLGEVCEKSTEKNVNSIYESVLSNTANYGLIPQRDYFDKDIANSNNISGYYIVKENDFVYNPRLSSNAEVGAMNVNKTGMIGIVSPLYTVFNILSSKVSIDFLELFFRTKVWHPYMRSIANYGVRDDRMNIKDKDFFSLPISLPSLPEQQKIADFLSGVDEKIGQLERRLALEEQYKKGMMQRLFDQEIRFKDDNGNEFPDWEEKKLGEVCERIGSGKNKSKEETGLYPVYGSIGVIGYTDVYLFDSKLILVARVGANAGSLNLINEKCDISDNTLIIEIKDSCIEFILDLLSHIDLNKLAFGSGQPLITATQLKLLPISLPSLPEQQKIADFLSSLDDKIGQTKAELEKARVWKRGLMQRMFV